MTELEKQLAEEKKRLGEVAAPAELQDRLRIALDKAPKRKKNRMPQWIGAAVALLFLSVISYQYNAFAYYGKKLLGYDEIMSDTLAELNEAGHGQEINKKITLQTGSELLLDGVLTDENRLILYYTISNPNGIKEEILFHDIQGFMTYSHAVSGTYSPNENHTQIKGIQTFTPVSPFAKELTLSFNESISGENQNQQEISFPYNPKAAMQTTLKQSIKKKVKVDKGVIRFDSITATPSQTVIKGKMNVDNFDRTALGYEGIHLVANGVQLSNAGGGTSSSIGGKTFLIDYEALPKELESLELHVDSFVGYKMINETVSLIDMEGKSVYIGGQELLIRKMEKAADGIWLTVATTDDVLLEGVAIQTGERSVPLETTLRADYFESKDGKLFKERVLLFKDNELPESMTIEAIHYKKDYQKVISIPIH